MEQDLDKIIETLNGLILSIQHRINEITAALIAMYLIEETKIKALMEYFSLYYKKVN